MKIMQEIAKLLIVFGTTLALIERTSSFTYSTRSPSIWSIAFMVGWLFITLIAIN